MYKYFSFPELIKTDQDYRNFPTTLDQVECLISLARLLEDIREDYGSPIIVNSAYRDPIVNAKVGGSPNSYHLQGRAADIRPDYFPACEYSRNFQRLVDVVKNYQKHLIEFIIDPSERYIHIAIKYYGI